MLLAILRGCLFPAFYLEFIVIHDLRSHFENDKLCVLTNRLKANEDKKNDFKFILSCGNEKMTITTG